MVDILLSARLAREYVAGTTWEAFVADRQRQDAADRLARGYRASAFAFWGS
ncbi:MAG TPA: hypothetical protein VH257_21640 [Chloroflexota bacterium]|nr:hypothetical protein [Chloroflexota bacterium]